MNTATKIFGFAFAMAMIIALPLRSSMTSTGSPFERSERDRRVQSRPIPESNFDILSQFGVVIEPKPQYVSVKQVAQNNGATVPTNDLGWYDGYSAFTNPAPESTVSRPSSDESSDVVDQEDPDPSPADPAVDGSTSTSSSGPTVS